MFLAVVIALLWFALCMVFIQKSLPNSNWYLSGGLSLIGSQALLSVFFVASVFAQLAWSWFQLISILIPIGLLYYLYSQTNWKHCFSMPSSKVNTFIFLIFAFLFYRFTKNFLAHATYWGHWDAWAIWSLHAKFLLQGQGFFQLFSEPISWTHADYPFLLPGTIAFYWQALGKVEPIAPLIIAYMTSVSILMIGWSSFVSQKRALLSIIFMYLLVDNGILLPFAVSQYADTLLALFILISFILFYHAPYGNKKYVVPVIGFFVASCAWIKNEGILFVVLFSVAFIIRNINQKKEIVYFLLGCLIPILLVMYFKLFLSAENDLIKATNKCSLTQLSDFKRHKITLDYFYNYLTTEQKGLVLLLFFSSIFRVRFLKSFGLVVLVLMLVGYYVVYIFSPHDLLWHLNTSCPRLIHHVSPTLVYLSLMNMAGKKLVIKKA